MIYYIFIKSNLNIDHNLRIDLILSIMWTESSPWISSCYFGVAEPGIFVTNIPWTGIPFKVKAEVTASWIPPYG